MVDPLPSLSALDARVRLRRFEAADVDAAHGLSTEAQWPHSAMDWRIGIELGQGLVAIRDQELVGTGIRWLWGTRHASIGMLIVAAQAQRQGIGTGLMTRLLAGLEGRSVQLHAPAAGQRLCESLGFEVTGLVHQHQGIAQPAPLPRAATGERLRPAGRNDPPRLAALDAEALGWSRERALSLLLDRADVVVLERDAQATGFAVMRRFGRGLAIGPVVAPDLPAARALIGHFLRMVSGRFVRIDVPSDGGLGNWLEGLGLQLSGQAFQMVKGEQVQPAREFRSHALLSQSLG